MDMRTTRPSNNKYFIRRANGGYNGAIQGSPTVADANVLANCVGYANGRFHEIIGEGNCKYELTCNAENFIERAKSNGLKVVDEPTLGGIMVFQKGSLSDGDGAGHVMVVEKFNSNDQVYVSESAYGSTSFYNSTRSRGNGNWGMSSSYKYRGCIVNPKIGEVRYTPPTPAPEPPKPKKSAYDVANDIVNAPNYGGWGTGQERADKLKAAGYNYDEVQGYVNQIVNGQKPAPAPSSEISKGDRVIFNGTKSYSGVGLAGWTKGYTFDVIEVSGDRVVIGKGSAVTAAVNIRDLTKV